MPGQEADHLTRNLKIRHPSVEVDPVKTLQIQTHMPIQDIVHRHHTGCHGLPPGRNSPTRQPWPHPTATSSTNSTTRLGGPRRSLFSTRPTIMDRISGPSRFEVMIVE